MAVYIYDISAMIHSGALAYRSKFWNHYCYPTGGIYKVLTYLVKDMKRLPKGSKIIACFDSGKSIRKDRYPDYKANRIGKYSPTEKRILSLQYEVLEEALDKIGVLVAKVDGLEADDLIYSFNYAFKDEEVIIRADDGDLEDTRLFNPQARLESVAGRDSILMGNNVIISKIINGDPKDNIFPLEKDIIKRDTVWNAYYNGYINIFDPNLEYEKLMVLGLGEDFTNSLAKNIFLKAPKIINVGEIEDTVINKDELRKFLSVFSLNKFLKSNNMDKDTSREVSETLIKYLSKLDEDVRGFFLNKEYVTSDYELNINEYLAKQSYNASRSLSSIEDKTERWAQSRR